MKQHKGFTAAAGLLVAGSLSVSACTHLDTPPTYAKGVKVDCGGKQDITGSGSTAQANAMSHFITSYEESCSGKQLNYTASGSGAGVTDFLAAKTDFGGSDSPLSGDEYAGAKQRCGGTDAWNLPAVFGPIAITFNEWSYARRQPLDVAGIKTAGGVVGIGNDWVGKTISDVTIKGQGHDPNDLVLDLSKVYAATTPGAYPILLASYELVCSKYPHAQVGTAVKAFMQSTVTTGQQGLTPLGYIPLPADFQTRVAAAVNSIS